jgi:hypothetical protein
MIEFFADPKKVLYLLLAVIVGTAVIVFLIITVERWLLCILNALDKALTKIGFGTYSARALTAAENWFRDRREKR